MAGDWVLLILDVIGAGVLAAALIIALWRRAASHPRELSHRGAALPPEMRREFRPSLLSYTSFKA
jgi:hypothetical protein